MYDTSIYVSPALPVDLETIVLVLTSILLAVIVTAELNLLRWHAGDCTGKLPGELYIIIVKACFECVHILMHILISCALFK